MAELTAVEKKPRRTLLEVMDDHPRTVFLTRAILWLLCAAGLPFMFIAYRFELFKSVSKIQIGGWGLIAIIIVAVVAITVLRYIKAAYKNGYSYFGQIIMGICKVVIPLVALYWIVLNIRNNLDLFLQALGCTIICETVGIFINPFPKWVWEKQKNMRIEERKEGIDYWMNEFFRRKENNDKSE